MNVTIVQAPTAYPISVAEAKRHLRITDTSSDTDVTAMLAACVSAIETITRRALCTRQLALRLDGFPDGDIMLPFAPLRSVSSIAYVDENGDSQTWSSSLYQVDIRSEPGRIRPIFGEVYPDTRDETMNTVTVTYRCGIATPFTAAAATDLLTATGHALIDTDVVNLYHSGPEGAALPAGVSTLTDYYARDVTAAVSLKLSATSGGSAVDVTGTGTGTGSQFYLGVVPEPILQSIKLLLGHIDQNRESVNIGNIVNELPQSVDWLLADHRVHRFNL